MRKGWTIGLAVAAALALPGTAGGAAPAAERGADSELDGAMQTVQRLIVLNREGKLQSPEAAAMLSGELADIRVPTFGPFGPPDLVVAIDGGAVVRVPATNAFFMDVYFYLKRSGDGWTIHAVRMLAISVAFDQARRELRAMPTRTAEEDAMLRNLDFTFRSDAWLRTWFGGHRGDLAAMRGMKDADAQAAAKRLDGTLFGKSPEGFDQFVIGGVLDNMVGFLFVPEGKAPPAISADGYIWIEAMGGGWYLFRTT